MVQEPISCGLYFWNDKKQSGFSVEDELKNSKMNPAAYDVTDYGYLNLVDESEADHKRIRLMGSDQQDGRSIDLFGESRPLGLTLRKTPSFLDLIETKLAQGNKATTKDETKQTTNYEKSKSRANNFSAQQMEKLKASNFSATLLKIGNWKRVAKNEGELVAKCYYAKRKLVWEVLDQGLKSKIEIQWSDISAIRAVFPENGPGILDIELSTAPLFFKEMNPQPRKHTLWTTATDFTGGQASTYRRHHVEFPEGTLEKHYQKLLQCDNRLFMLSQRPFPFSNSQFFQSNLSGYPDFYLNFNEHQPTPMMQLPQLGIQRPTLYPSHQVQNLNHTIRPPMAPKNQVSQLPVMDDILMEENNGYQGIHQHRTSFPHQRVTDEEIFYRSSGGGNQFQVQELPMIAPINQVHPFIPQYNSSHLNSFVNGSERLNSDGWALNNIVNHLFDEPVTPLCSNDQRVLAKIRSMNCLLEAAKEQNQVHENPCMDYTEYSYGANMNTSEPSSTDQSYENGELPNTDQFNRDLFMGMHRNPSFPYISFEPSSHNVDTIDPSMVQAFYGNL